MYMQAVTGAFQLLLHPCVKLMLSRVAKKDEDLRRDNLNIIPEKLLIGLEVCMKADSPPDKFFLHTLPLCFTIAVGHQYLRQEKY